jgi:hypothetical protein
MILTGQLGKIFTFLDGMDLDAFDGDGELLTGADVFAGEVVGTLDSGAGCTKGFSDLGEVISFLDGDFDGSCFTCGGGGGLRGGGGSFGGGFSGGGGFGRGLRGFGGGGEGGGGFIGRRGEGFRLRRGG